MASPKSANSERPRFRADIEGLRAIAILLVVLFHAGVPGFQGGFIGVDIFFVISGYLISEILVNEIETTGRLDFARFYGRRARRLLPASLLMILMTLTAGFATLSPLEMSRFSMTAAATAAYVSNFWFLHNTLGYFGQKAESNPFLHTWSLAVEEQFYFVWPFLLSIALRRRSSRRTVLWVVGIGSGISLASCIWLTRTHQPWAFFTSPTRCWEFGIGALATIIPMKNGLLKSHRHILGWIGLAGIAVANFSFSRDTVFPGTAAILPVLATAAVLVGGEVRTVGMSLSRVLEKKPLQVIGGLSYSWYLWHWPVLVIGGAVIPGLWLGGRSLTLSHRVLLIILAFGVAAATHHLLENPIRFSAFLAVRPGRSLKMAAAITCVGLFVSLAAYDFSSKAAQSPRYRLFSNAADDGSGGKECMVGFADSRLRECSFGDEGSAKRVVLFGDSHAAQLLPAITDIAEKRGWNVVTMLKGSCPVARVPIYNPILARDETECITWREEALQRIVALRPYAVFIENSTGYIKRAGFEDAYARLLIPEWADGLRNTLKVLNDARVQTVLIRDSPRPSLDIPICLSRLAGNRKWFPAGSCTVSPRVALSPEVWAAEESAAKGLPYITTVDLSTYFCDGDSCPPIVNGTVVYRDGNHITAAFSARLAPVLASRLSFGTDSKTTSTLELQ